MRCDVFLFWFIVLGLDSIWVWVVDDCLYCCAWFVAGFGGLLGLIWLFGCVGLFALFCLDFLCLFVCLLIMDFVCFYCVIVDSFVIVFCFFIIRFNLRSLLRLAVVWVLFWVLFLMWLLFILLILGLLYCGVCFMFAGGLFMLACFVNLLRWR